MNPVLCAIAVIVADLQPLATSGIILTKSVKLFAPHVTNQCWQWHRLIRGLLSRVLAKGETQVVAVTENPKTKSCYKDAVREETHRQTSQRDRPAGTREEVDKKNSGEKYGEARRHHKSQPWNNSSLMKLPSLAGPEEGIGEKEGDGGGRERRSRRRERQTGPAKASPPSDGQRNLVKSVRRSHRQMLCFSYYNDRPAKRLAPPRSSEQLLTSKLSLGFTPVAGSSSATQKGLVAP